MEFFFNLTINRAIENPFKEERVKLKISVEKLYIIALDNELPKKT